jgi:hypothetical protein
MIDRRILPIGEGVIERITLQQMFWHACFMPPTDRLGYRDTREWMA